MVFISCPAPPGQGKVSRSLDHNGRKERAPERAALRRCHLFPVGPTSPPVFPGRMGFDDFIRLACLCFSGQRAWALSPDSLES